MALPQSAISKPINLLPGWDFRYTNVIDMRYFDEVNRCFPSHPSGPVTLGPTTSYGYGHDAMMSDVRRLLDWMMGRAR